MTDSTRPAPLRASARRVTARANGAEYEVRVWRPPLPAGAARLPTVYVLDGGDFFCTIVEAVARTSKRPDATGVGAAIVVGVDAAEGTAAGGAGAATGTDPGTNSATATATGPLTGTARRHLDYTPGPPAEEPPGKVATGGVDAFLSFLHDELAPAIERDHPADPARRVLFGHSLAGYCVLQALTSGRGGFETYIAVSPSIWWNEAALRAGFERAAAVPFRAFIAVGEWEGELPPWQRHRPEAGRIAQRRELRRMIERAQRFAADLGDLAGAEEVAFYLFPDEDHASVALVAIARSLRFALGPAAHSPDTPREPSST